jgi:hypothetical protein
MLQVNPIQSYLNLKIGLPLVLKAETSGIFVINDSGRFMTIHNHETVKIFKKSIEQNRTVIKFKNALGSGHRTLEDVRYFRTPIGTA